MKIGLFAIGKLRGYEADWWAEYVKRMRWSVAVKEFSASKNISAEATQQAEAALLLAALPEKGTVILLDERGKDISSRDLATKIQNWEDEGQPCLSFIIGGADGVTDTVRQRADFIMGFGKLTWPHRLVRVMLIEQLYRAQQINAGHPYHRD